jgi:hypothetical protein
MVDITNYLKRQQARCERKDEHNRGEEMDEKELEKLWKVLSSATNINSLEYDEAVTIGSVFGKMKAKILEQQEEIQRLETELMVIR